MLAGKIDEGSDFQEAIIACALLLDFLMVAGSSPNENTKQPITAMTAYKIDGHDIDAEVTNDRRIKMLHVQLPDLKPSTISPTATTRH